MKVSASYILIILLIGLNAYWIYKSKVESRINQNLIATKTSLSNEVEFLDKSIDLITTSNLNTSLQEFLTKPTVVFFYTDKSCEACVERVYSDLVILAESIGKDNILIVSNNPFPRTDLNAAQHGFKELMTESLGLSIEELNNPFLFVTDGRFISNIFVPEVFEKSRVDYFESILPSYFN